MRTKALLGLAALAASAVTVMAQSNVYSLNVVGYYNIPVAAHANTLIANQLNTTNNQIQYVVNGLPAGSQLSKYSGGFSVYVYDFDDNNNLNWNDGTPTLNPGEGAFVLSPSATTLTFVGEVMQGALANPMPANSQYLRSSMVPQAGLITTALGLNGDPGDQLSVYSGGFTVYVYDFDDNNNLNWNTEPNIAVGQSFFYKKSPIGTSTSWVRNFTVQ